LGGINKTNVMKTKEKAGNILAYVYGYRNERASSRSIASASGFSMDEVNETLKYLENKDLIDFKNMMMDGNYHTINLKSDGISIVEDNKEFKKTFTVCMNFGVFSASWSKTK
jgi:predicted transcriptional regulator